MAKNHEAKGVWGNAWGRFPGIAPGRRYGSISGEYFTLPDGKQGGIAALFLLNLSTLRVTLGHNTPADQFPKKVSIITGDATVVFDEPGSLQTFGLGNARDYRAEGDGYHRIRPGDQSEIKLLYIAPVPPKEAARAPAPDPEPEADERIYVERFASDAEIQGYMLTPEDHGGKNVYGLNTHRFRFSDEATAQFWDWHKRNEEASNKAALEEHERKTREFNRRAAERKAELEADKPSIVVIRKAMMSETDGRVLVEIRSGAGSACERFNIVHRKAGSRLLGPYGNWSQWGSGNIRRYRLPFGDTVCMLDPRHDHEIAVIGSNNYGRIESDPVTVSFDAELMAFKRRAAERERALVEGKPSVRMIDQAVIRKRSFDVSARVIIEVLPDKIGACSTFAIMYRDKGRKGWTRWGGGEIPRGRLPYRTTMRGMVPGTEYEIAIWGSGRYGRIVGDSIIVKFDDKTPRSGSYFWGMLR